jgi:hypothetical protein
MNQQASSAPNPIRPKVADQDFGNAGRSCPQAVMRKAANANLGSAWRLLGQPFETSDGRAKNTIPFRPSIVLCPGAWLAQFGGPFRARSRAVAVAVVDAVLAILKWADNVRAPLCTGDAVDLMPGERCVPIGKVCGISRSALDLGRLSALLRRPLRGCLTARDLVTVRSRWLCDPHRFEGGGRRAMLAALLCPGLVSLGLMHFRPDLEVGMTIVALTYLCWRGVIPVSSRSREATLGGGSDAGKTCWAQSAKSAASFVAPLLSAADSGPGHSRHIVAISALGWESRNCQLRRRWQSTG